jgi:CheY-like chemotaxis protein
MLLRSLSRRLKKRWDVVTAASGREALESLAGAPVDVIVSDVMIPEMSGAEIHRAVAERDEALARRMVFMTGGAFGDAERAAVEGLPNPVIEKPFELEELEVLLLDLLDDDG